MIDHLLLQWSRQDTVVPDSSAQLYQLDSALRDIQNERYWKKRATAAATTSIDRGAYRNTDGADLHLSPIV